jgi:hypothetical protein
MTREEHKEQWKNYHPLDLDVNDVIDKVYDDFEKEQQNNLESELAKSIVINGLRDKLKKAKSYIVDLENQLKNKQNGWMNK